MQGYGCTDDLCTGQEGLVVMSDNDFTWRAEDLATELPYVCMSKCMHGYKWFQSTNKCIKVVKDAK